MTDTEADVVDRRAGEGVGSAERAVGERPAQERAAGGARERDAEESTRHDRAADAGSVRDPDLVRSAVDPLDEAPSTTPHGSLTLTILAFVLGVAAFAPTGLSFVLGPIGMGCGLVAHLKGRRAGFAAAVVAGVGTVVGLSLRALLDMY